jgi:hypothetical protein
MKKPPWAGSSHVLVTGLVVVEVGSCLAERDVIVKFSFRNDKQIFAETALF